MQGRRRNYRLTEKGARAYRNERLRLRLCLADAERGRMRGETMTENGTENHTGQSGLCPVWCQLCACRQSPAQRRAA